MGFKMVMMKEAEEADDEIIPASWHQVRPVWPNLSFRPATSDLRGLHLRGPNRVHRGCERIIMESGPALTSATGTSVSAGPSTQRITRACGSCSRQKVRCDGGHPCGRCTALKQPEACEYRPSMRGKTRKRKTRPRQNGINEEEEDVDRRPTGDRLGGDVVRDNEERERHYASWKRTNSLCEQGIPNTAVWGDATKRENAGLPIPAADPALALNHRLTTLPLPGDAPNPLAMLAEASASAQAAQASPPGATLAASSLLGAPPSRSTAHQDESTDAYYAPFQKRLKDDAPHIMTLISVSE